MQKEAPSHDEAPEAPAGRGDASPAGEAGVGLLARLGGCAGWTVLGIVGLSAAALLAAAILVYVTVRRGEALIAHPLAGLASPQPTAQLQTQAVILEQLQRASELSTAIFTMETVIDESQERKLAGLTLGRTELLYVAHGQVRAGVDLDSMGADDVSIDGEVITVKLSAPRIHDAKIDVDKSYVYDLKKSLLGPADQEIQSRAERFALQKILAAACSEGILDQANERAALTVRTLLETAGYRSVVVQTRAAAPGSCVQAAGTPGAPTPSTTPSPGGTAAPS